jgi:ankyrin repeat protein
MVPEAKLLSSCMNRKSDAESLQGVMDALQQGADIDIVDTKSGQTPLMAAILRGKFLVVQYLLEHGADVTVAEKDGFNPAHGAAHAGNLEIMQLLHDRGLDVISDEHVDGSLPFHHACRGKTSGHTRVVEYLLKVGVDPDLEDSDGNRCIEITRNVRTKQVLVSYGASASRLDENGEL